MKRLISLLCVLALVLTMAPAAVFADETAGVDFAVLSTTDMHGKCWDKNVLTDGNETNNMLRVSTAVKQYRESFGENLLLIDNGDAYQGTAVSTVQLKKISSGESTEPAAMALCFTEIGYDMAVLGNHEFNYPWKTMTTIYDYLKENGVPTVTANLYYDGSDGVHEAGTNVFTPYLVKTVTVGGHAHKIGILGLENTDCPRWDVSDNYPGIVFAHPDNTTYSLAWEAQRYIPQMQAEGCEFIIVSCHTGPGATTGELTFGVNTEGQASRIIYECEGIDMMIAGHDHKAVNTYYKDKNGKQVLVVNGGGTQLTESVFTFTEDAEGKLTYTIKESKNLSLGGYAIDADLKAKVQPYADMAVEYVNQVAGSAVGTWDTSSNYYLQQTNTMDLVNCAQMAYGTKHMAEVYGSDEAKAALFEKTGLDHIDVDMSGASPVTSNNYYVRPGQITMKTVVQMYRFDNNVLYLLALTGQQIKDILEQNAETRLKATVRNGVVSYSTIGEDFTNVVFGGLNFTYDMYQPAGSRAVITGFSNGREFALDKTYIVACNSYHLGNTGCGFGQYQPEDSIWNQNKNIGDSNIQEAIWEYVHDQGEITTEPFTWAWKLDYTGDLDAPTTLQGDYVAQKADGVADGDEIVIYYNAEGTVIGKAPAQNTARLSAVDVTAVGDYIGFSDEAAIFTVETVDGENDPFLLKNELGYLTAGETGNSLGFADEPTECSQWYLAAAEGGWHIMNVGANYQGSHNQALEWYTGFTTYGVKDTAVYLFNIYKLVDTAKRASELTNGRKYVIYYDAEELCVGAEDVGGGLGSTKNTVSGDFMLLPLAENTLVVTANIDEAGQIDFVSEDGRHLTSNLAGNGVQLTEAPDENECSLWTLVAVNGGWHVMNVGANYQGNHNQAFEYYNSKFTTYGVKDTEAYLFNFYELVEADEPTEDRVIELVDIGNIWTGFDLVNPMAFTAELNPALPELAEQMEIAEETWVNDADESVYRLSDGDTLPLPTRGTYHYSITLRAKDGYVFGDNFRFIYGGTEQELSGMVVMLSQDGKELTLSGFVPAITLMEKVAALFDVGGIDDGGFNQSVHEAVKAWCEEKGAEYAYYVQDGSYDDFEEEAGAVMAKQAIADGAKILIVPGFMNAAAAASCAEENPDVTFLLLDVSQYELMPEDAGDDWTLPANIYCATFREEQAGYLAGYAAVAMGYNKLGFLGGPEFPGIARFGYGFVQGANDAAKALGREDEVEVKFVYTGQFAPNDEMTEFVDGWYKDGVEIVFACGGGIWVSAAQAAAANGGKLIGVDADQKDQINEFGDGLCLTSAIKNMGATAVLQLDALLGGSFEGGREENCGIVSADPAENPVGLAPSTVYNDSFTEENYKALLAQIVAGELTISDETEEKPETEITVLYQCYTACDWGEPSYEWAEDNSTVTATAVCGNDASHILTETVNNTVQTTTAPTCLEDGEGVYTAVFENELFAQQVKQAPIAALGHDWGDIRYEWAADNTTCTASVACKRDETHVRSEVADVISWVSKQPTAEEEGERSYQAVFAMAPFETQLKTEAIPKLNEPTPITNPFVDVNENNWYYDSVMWAIAQDPQITGGTDETHFSPNNRCTRAQVMLFLYAYAKKPAVTGTSPFTDVKAGAWYHDAVLWAVSQEPAITGGIGNNKFGPNNKCTRAQVMMFLWVYAGKPQAALTQSPFSDVKQGAYYYDAVLWAVENEITGGVGGGKFGSTSYCTRAQVMTFLYKFSLLGQARGTQRAAVDLTALQAAVKDAEAVFVHRYTADSAAALQDALTSAKSLLGKADAAQDAVDAAALALNGAIGALKVQAMTDEELWLFDKINQDRVAAGKPALGIDPYSYACARIRVAELNTKYDFARPDGRLGNTVFDDWGVERPGSFFQLISRHSWYLWSIQSNYIEMSSSPYYTNILFGAKYMAVCLCPGETHMYTEVLFLG